MRRTCLVTLASAALAAVWVAGCSSDKRAPDVTPPASVTDLSAATRGSSSVLLKWTAPGDDGTRGQAAAYDIRYSQTALTDPIFAAARAVTNPPTPGLTGSTDSVLIGPLEHEKTYYFALKTTDDASNTSAMSNVASIKTPVGPDNIAPAAVTDLRATRIESRTTTLKWTATGNDGAIGMAAGYDLRYSTEPITDATWAGATPVTGLPVPRAPGATETFPVTGLAALTPYYFGLKVADDAGNVSGLSNVLQSTTLRRPQVWRIRVDGTGDAPRVQAGIDSAVLGDTVLVAPGTYYECIDFLGKDIVVKSEAGPEVTVLDGSRGDNSVVLFAGPETRAAVLGGFTITGGSGSKEHASERRGGGIYSRDASPTVRGNRVVANRVHGAVFATGGGMRAGSGYAGLPRPSPLIVDNVFESNQAVGNGGGLAVVRCCAIVEGNTFRSDSCKSDGGGLWLYLITGETVTLVKNEFWDNTAGDHGGGVYAGGGVDCIISENLFVRNRALGAGIGDTGSGGGLAVLESSGLFARNTLVSNVAAGESGCSGGGILIFQTPGDLAVTGNIIASNIGCGLSCRWNAQSLVGTNLFWQNDSNIGEAPEVCPAGWSEKSIIADPLFCDPASDNYTVAANSPALAGKEVMGAFETPGCGARSARAPGIWYRTRFRAR
jgi:hypothetical protein